MPFLWSAVRFLLPDLQKTCLDPGSGSFKIFCFFGKSSNSTRLHIMSWGYNQIERLNPRSIKTYQNNR